MEQLYELIEQKATIIEIKYKLIEIARGLAGEGPYTNDNAIEELLSVVNHLDVAENKLRL